MSEFTFSCPLCHQDIVCDEQYHGQQLQCPICQGEITAPAAETKPAGKLGIRMTGGEKHMPVGPRFQKPVVAEKKSGLGKGAMVTVAILLVLVMLFFVARYTGYDRYLPAFLGRRSPTIAADTTAGAGPDKTAAAPAEAAAATPPPPPASPAPVGWMTNLANAEIPTNTVHGKITATDFNCDSAQVVNGILFLRQGKDASPDLELGVLFGLRAGESLAGKTFDVGPEARVAPRVWKKWRVAGKPVLQQKVYSKGYAMKLQFGEVTEDKISGKVYLCLPDEEQTAAAGSFVASFSAAMVAQPAVQPATTPATPMSEDMRKRYGVRGPARP